jgi:EmrB/QacA subfamily drug resistance transporter
VSIRPESDARNRPGRVTSICPEALNCGHSDAEHAELAGQAGAEPAGSAAPALLSISERRGRLTLLALVLGSGMAFLDGTVVNVALPTIGSKLHADVAGLQWVVSAYSLTLAALILLGGSLGDRFGRRRVYLFGVTGFAASSLLCAVAPNIQLLVAARAVQGVAAALLTPGSLAILQASFRPEDRMRAIGAWSGLTGVATAAGPILGGWLVSWTWRSIFWLNLPLAAVVILLSRNVVPESKDAQASHHLDTRGVLLAALGLAGTTYALTAWGGNGATTFTVLAAAVGVLALIGFVIAERRDAHPMVPLSLFGSRDFSVVNFVTLVVYAGLSGCFLFLVLQLQVSGGYSPLEAGAATAPVSVLMLFLSARAGGVVTRLGARLMIGVGAVVAAMGLLVLSTIGEHPSYLTRVLPGICLFGLGMVVLVAPLTGTVLAAAPDRFAGTASGINNAVARTGGLLAIASLPLLVGLSGDAYANPATLTPAYRDAMLICVGLLAVGSVVAFAGITRGAGRVKPT